MQLQRRIIYYEVLTSTNGISMFWYQIVQLEESHSSLCLNWAKIHYCASQNLRKSVIFDKLRSSLVEAKEVKLVGLEVVKPFVVLKISSWEQGQSDWEHFSWFSEIEALDIALLQKFDLFRSQVSWNVVQSLLIFVELEWPSVKSGNFDVSTLIEHDVLRSHITEHFYGFIGLNFGFNETEQQVPHILFCKLVLSRIAIEELIVQKIGIVGVIYLFGNRDTSTVPAVPQREVLVKCWVSGKKSLL